MSATIISRRAVVYGVTEPKPLAGFPEGKIRIRLRHNSFGRAFVRTADGIREFVILDDGETWIPGPERGANLNVREARP